MTLHLRFTCLYGDGRVKKLDFVLPPAVVQGTAAEDLYAALVARLPWSLDDVKGFARNVMVITNSDSARSCLKLSRHLGSILPSLPCQCRMHQLVLAMNGVLSLGGVGSALFCASLLFRRKRVQSMMRKHLLKLVSDRLKIVFMQPPQEAHLQKKKIIIY